MRTRSPCSVVVMRCTGVPKSLTSKRRRSPSDNEARKNSTTRLLPCSRISTPIWLLAKPTTMRPEPSLPRRKSTSFSGSMSLVALSANTGVGGAADGAVVALAAATGASDTTKVLP